MALLRRSLNDILRIDLNVGALDQLQWRDFGNGLSMSRLAHEGKRELILYRIAATASSDAFLKHEHIGASFIPSLEARSPMRPGSMWKAMLFFWIGNRCIHPEPLAIQSFWYSGRRACVS